MDYDKLIYIGENEIFFLGKIDSLIVHSHITWSLCICLDGSFVFKSMKFKTMINPSDTILIPPGLEHELEAISSTVIILFFEKNSHLLKNIQKEYPITFLKDEIYLNMYNDFNFKKSIRKEDLKPLIQNYLKLLNIQFHRKQEIDSRVQKVIEVLNLSITDKKFSIPELSEKVNLSESRLSHLFKKEIGLPISTFRSWLKLKQLGKSLELGKSLTFAAQEAGFYDSSHFNRVFKNYFGLNPKKVFMKSRILWIHK